VRAPSGARRACPRDADPVRQPRADFPIALTVNGQRPGRAGSPRAPHLLWRVFGPAAAGVGGPPWRTHRRSTAPPDTQQIIVMIHAPVPAYWPFIVRALPLVRKAPFFDEVLGQLQPHHQFVDLGRASVSSPLLWLAAIRRPRVPCSRKTPSSSRAHCAALGSRANTARALARSSRSTNSSSVRAPPSGNSGKLCRLAFTARSRLRFFAPMVDLLGSRHRIRDGVQRDRSDLR